jgi:hypothetical protein
VLSSDASKKPSTTCSGTDIAVYEAVTATDLVNSSSSPIIVA